MPERVYKEFKCTPIQQMKGINLSQSPQQQFINSQLQSELEYKIQIVLQVTAQRGKQQFTKRYKRKRNYISLLKINQLIIELYKNKVKKYCLQTPYIKMQWNNDEQLVTQIQSYSVTNNQLIVFINC
ncbi:unnamed protein product [Paramecium primaurelia]|uniref:Uncharacterized protein n=1 Tax=Paramecium primaurelia TaxID=5886 RepID=A0A8S1KVE8_PARPR|nr:unnamed protein product [Paramecium primaurelia]